MSKKKSDWIKLVQSDKIIGFGAELLSLYILTNPHKVILFLT